jgi:hypothetical protein
MAGRVLAFILSLAGVSGLITAALTAAENQVAADTLLVQGSPPLSSDMVDHRIAVWESFLQVRFTDAQRAQLRDLIVADWQKDDKKAIKDALEDLKLYDQPAQLEKLRAVNQDSFVENLRAKKDAQGTILLAAFEAAHPDKKDIMRPRGYGDLVGIWSRGDAMPMRSNPITGRLEGISFSESSIIRIFSDGRFQHAWLHRHCGNGDRCCNEYSTAIQGGLAIEGQNFVLSGESGKLDYKNPCIPATNTTKALGPQRETVGWSLKHDPSNNALVLCLTEEPFQLSEQAQHHAVCYAKKRP